MEQKYNEIQSKEVKYIDLFCGMGSFHYSFQKLGFKCVMASDIYKPAKETYQSTKRADEAVSIGWSHSDNDENRF